MAAAAPSGRHDQLLSAKGKKEVRRFRLSGASPLATKLQPAERPTMIMLGHRYYTDEAEEDVTYFGLLQKLTENFAIVNHPDGGKKRDAFVAKSAAHFYLNGLTIGPTRSGTGYYVGNLTGTSEEKIAAIMSAFEHNGTRLARGQITLRRSNADETWMCTFDDTEAYSVGPREIFSVHVGEPVELKGFSAAKETLILISDILKKKQSGKKIVMHLTPEAGKTEAGFNRPFIKSFYAFIKRLEGRKKDGRDRATHGAAAKHRLYMGVVDVVLRSAKALSPYYGEDYSQTRDEDHVEYCVRAAKNMMDTCKEIEVKSESAKKLTFDDDAPGPLRLYTGGYAAKKGLEDAFVHLIL